LAEILFLNVLLDRCKRLNHTSTCWFHFTRNFPEEKYDRGILPIRDILDTLWTKLNNLAKLWISNSKWKEFRSWIEDANNDSKGSILYRDKLENSKTNQFGPYGLLIYDVNCFNIPICELDYLKDGSEVIYHICDAFQEMYKYNLFERYIRNTKPCIVKFLWPEANTVDIGHVLSALYYHVNTRKISLDNNPLFPGRGIIVPLKILKKLIIWKIKVSSTSFRIITISQLTQCSTRTKKTLTFFDNFKCTGITCVLSVIV